MAEPREQINEQGPQELFKLIFDNAVDGILLADLANKKFYDGNKAICRMLGCTLEEVKALGVTDIHPEKDLPYVIDQFEKQTRGEITAAKDIPVKRKDGSVFFADVNSAPVTLRGKTYLIGFFRDATERREAENELRGNKNYLQSLLDCANAPIVVWDPGLRITVFNHAFERLTGLIAEEAVGQPLSILFSPETIERSMALIKEAAAGERWETVDIPILCKNGDIRLVLWNSANIYTKDGKTLSSTIAQGQDITERKRAEEELRKSEGRFQLAMSATEDGVWEWDIITNQEYFSPRWCEIVGYAFADPGFSHSYISWESRIHPDDLDRVRSALNGHLEKGTKYDIEYRHRHRSGEYRWQRSTGLAVRDVSGKPIKMVGCISDITERKRIEEELKKKVKELEDFLDLAVGRELRMVELKKRIRELGEIKS